MLLLVLLMVVASVTPCSRYTRPSVFDHHVTLYCRRCTCLSHLTSFSLPSSPPPPAAAAADKRSL